MTLFERHHSTLLIHTKLNISTKSHGVKRVGSNSNGSHHAFSSFESKIKIPPFSRPFVLVRHNVIHIHLDFRFHVMSLATKHFWSV